MYAASTAKSAFDFLSKPPPSSVTWQVTFSTGISNSLATELCRLCGSWVGAQTVTYSGVMREVVASSAIAFAPFSQNSNG